MAVGEGSGPTKGGSLMEQWNGGRWRRDPSPNPAPTAAGEPDLELDAVSCADQHHCVAIGRYWPSLFRARPLAEIYEDGEWVIRSPTTTKELSYDPESISCPTSSECVAVGYTARWSRPGPPVKKTTPLVELWDGQNWTAQRLPTPGGSLSQLDSVSCASPNSCTAVGEIQGSPGATFAERWNGHTWTRQAIPIPSQSSNPQFTFGDISCPTSRSCTAVLAPLGTDPIIAQLLANHWTIQSPN